MKIAALLVMGHYCDRTHEGEKFPLRSRLNNFHRVFLHYSEDCNHNTSIKRPNYWPAGKGVRKDLSCGAFVS